MAQNFSPEWRLEKLKKDTNSISERDQRAIKKVSLKLCNGNS